MNLKKVLIVIFFSIGAIGGYFLYQYIQDINYEKIGEGIEYWEEGEKEKYKETEIKEKVNDGDKVLENSEENILVENISSQENTNKIVIHIAGEVVNCGVFELEEGSRVIDAVNKAGGLTEKADVSEINLAYILSDEMKIYIPNKEQESKNSNEDETKYITNKSGHNVIERIKEEVKEESNLININKATQTELETLPGIGPSTALKIIKYREENGEYKSIEELKNVNGIGDSKFNNIKDLIFV